eukprot:2570305-Amphidinium_carterae.1
MTRIGFPPMQHLVRVQFSRKYFNLRVQALVVHGLVADWIALLYWTVNMVATPFVGSAQPSLQIQSTAYSLHSSPQYSHFAFFALPCTLHKCAFLANLAMRSTQLRLTNVCIDLPPLEMLVVGV